MQHLTHVHSRALCAVFFAIMLLGGATAAFAHETEDAHEHAADALNPIERLQQLRPVEKARLWKEQLEQDMGIGALRARINADASASTTATGTKAEVRAEANTTFRAALLERKQEWEQRKEAWQEKRNEIRAQITEKITDRAARAVQSIIDRINAEIDRLTGFLDRLEAQAEVKAQAGADTEVLELEIEAASDALVEAQSDADTAQEAITEAADAENPGEYVSQIRRAVNAAVQSVKAAHKAIGEAIRSLKSLETSVESSTDTRVEIQ